MKPASKFDAYAHSYDELHAQSIRAGGEPIEYYARYKVECLKRQGLGPLTRVLDYGCGIGNLTGPLTSAFDEIHGFDPSPKSLEVARSRVPEASFFGSSQELENSRYDLVVLSGVLHHVPVAERMEMLQSVASKLTDGGRIAVFEHNPWNPLTRQAVNDCPFDDDAVLLWPGEIRSLLAQCGFRDVGLDYIVFFPRALSFMRSLEPRLNWLFLGAQTFTMGTR